MLSELQIQPNSLSFNMVERILSNLEISFKIDRHSDVENRILRKN